MYNSILNIWKRKVVSTNIKFYYYNFWVVEKLRRFRFLIRSENFLRGFLWRKLFDHYEVIFLIDPNQYYLLPFISEKHKIIYLLRDPSVLQDSNNYEKELPIISRASAILGISNNLCSLYFKTYYGFTPSNVHLWPNTVDLELWNYWQWASYVKAKTRPLVGLAGNINYVIDIELLIYLAEKLPEIDFEFAGKIDLNPKGKSLMAKLLTLPNVRHIGFIDYNQFPSIVVNWDIGIVAAKTDHEYSLYLNNNKQYQYMALGKPFVTYRFNSDYCDFEDLVFIAENKADFVEKIRLALEKSKDRNNIASGIRIASKYSADFSAKQFLEIADNLI